MILLSFYDLQLIIYHCKQVAFGTFLQIQNHLNLSFSYNIFQQQSMLTKPVGTLLKHTQNNQRFNQTHQPSLQCQPNKKHSPPKHQPQTNRKSSSRRASSAGKIYTRKSTINKDNVNLPMNTYDRLINYNEVQNKLSKYMQCTINTTQRQKYNYLNQHYHQEHVYQPKFNTHFQYTGTLSRQGSQQIFNKHPSTFTSLQRKQSTKNVFRYDNVQTQQKQSKNVYYSLKNSRKSQQQLRSKQQGKPQALLQGKLYMKSQRKLQKKRQTCKDRPPSPKIDKKVINSQKKSQKKVQRKDGLSKKLECAENNKQNFIPLSNALINKKQTIPHGTRKQNLYNMSGINHQECKNQLQIKLKKIIHNYQAKNKELSFAMHQIQSTSASDKKQEKEDTKLVEKNCNHKDEKMIEPPFRQNNFKKAIDQLIDFNLKGIFLNKEIDERLQQTWKSLHKQILADQHLRIIKCFINDGNAKTIFNSINENRIKKIQMSALKTSTEEYDPFLLQKLNQTLKISGNDFSHKLVIKWISEVFVKYYEESQRNWIRDLSQQKIQSFIKNKLLEKQINGLRKHQAMIKNLTIRDFTRYLSTLFKANLRNRNVYQIHSRVKGTTYFGRFIELLQQKAGKGTSCKKSVSLAK